MDLLIEISELIFILGAAAVFGGFFHQRTEKSKDITVGMYQGALVALGGYLLVLLLAKIEYDLEPTTHTWVMIGILVVLAAVSWYFRKQKGSQMLAWLLAGGLAAAALAVQYIWQIS